LSLFGVCKEIIEWSSSEIKLELYLARIRLELLEYWEQPYLQGWQVFARRWKKPVFHGKTGLVKILFAGKNRFLPQK